VAWPRAIDLGNVSTVGEAALRKLASRPESLDDLTDWANSEGGEASRYEVQRLSRRLRDDGWLAVTVVVDEQRLYTLEPIRRPPPRRSAPEEKLVLSRFAVMRRSRGYLVIESPRSWCDLIVHSAEAALLVGTLAHDNQSTPDWSFDATIYKQMLHDLYWAVLAVPASSSEDSELRLRQWSPHELWFHERSRLGYRGAFGDGFGGTNWARGTFDPIPAKHEPFGGPTISLPAADLQALRLTDPTLTTVLEGRHSVRKHDDSQPISLQQLAELLYRAARTRYLRNIAGVEYMSRPHPSGGSVYELELYPVVRLANGLPPGMYHYDSHEHQLQVVREAGHPAVRRLLSVAAVGSVVGTEPQVLLLIGARFGRLMWKYESMPYALILKHVGVLYHNLYCVATAMGLAACGLGSGDSVAFAEATGLDPLVESSVGEFIVGGRPLDAPMWGTLE
jgi:SagB-type dehydrogenase family enzyme